MATDAFGNAIGNSVAGKHREAAERARVEQARVAEANQCESLIFSGATSMKSSGFNEDPASLTASINGFAGEPSSLFGLGASQFELEMLQLKNDAENVINEAKRTNKDNMSAKDLVEYFERSDVKLRTQSESEALKALEMILNVDSGQGVKGWQYHVLNGLDTEGYKPIREMYVMENLMDKYGNYMMTSAKAQVTDIALPDYRNRSIQERAASMSRANDAFTIVTKSIDFLINMSKDPNIKIGFQILENNEGKRGVIINRWTSRPKYPVIQPTESLASWLYPDSMSRQASEWFIKNNRE